MSDDNTFIFSELMKPSKGLVTQEVVTYLKREDKLVKISVKRNFTDNDYTDSMTTEILLTW